MRSLSGKLELGFWTYGLLSALGPSGPKLDFRPQVPKSFLRLDNFDGFKLSFWTK